MCLANIYQGRNTSKPIIRDIAYLKVDGDQIEVEKLLGEITVLKGTIKEIDFMNSDIIVEEVAYEKDEGLKS
jgi:predicted RNA-binding protein